MTISFLLLSGCSSNIKIIENNEFKPEKIKLVLPDNQSLENHRWSEKILYSSCEEKELFSSEELKISQDLSVEMVAMLDKDVYFTAFDYIKGQIGLYLLENNRSTKLYEAPDTIDIVDMLSKDGKIFFVEQYENCEVLKSYFPAEKSIKIIIEVSWGKYYQIYDCGDYVAFATTEDSITNHTFININNGTIPSKSFDNIDICPTHLVDNNYFVYRDISTGSIVFFDIDTDKVVATVSTDTSPNNSFDKAKVIRDNVILSDGFGIYIHSLSNNKTYIVHSREKTDWNENSPFYLVGNTVLFLDDYDVLRATDCDKNKSVEISPEMQIKCTNGVDAFIIEDDSGKIFKYIVK